MRGQGRLKNVLQRKIKCVNLRKLAVTLNYKNSPLTLSEICLTEYPVKVKEISVELEYDILSIRNKN